MTVTTTDPHVTLAVRSARFLFPGEAPLLAETLVTWLNAYDRPASDAPGMVGAINYTVVNGVVTFKDVARFIATVVPLAAERGESMESLLDIYASMTAHGVSGEIAEKRLLESLENDPEIEKAGG